MKKRAWLVGMAASASTVEKGQKELETVTTAAEQQLTPVET